MKQIKLTVDKRESHGRGPNRRLRASGRVPAVVYGKHTSPSSLSVGQSDVNRLVKALSGTAALVEISQEGHDPRLSIVQEIQRNPITDQVIHIDFQEVSAKEEMQTRSAIHLLGEAFGVRNQNGLLEFVLHQVDIRCLPKDLPEYIEVDVTDMKIGDSVHVRDLPAIEGVKYLSDADQVIVSCSEQRVDVVETAEAEVEEAVEGEGEAGAGEKEGGEPKEG